jgi:hypothetical protein
MSVVVDGTNGLVFNDGTAQVTAASGFGFKNRIINGDMRIDQRWGGAALSNAGFYIVDRWADYYAGNGRYTAQRSTVAPSRFSNSLQHTVTTAVSPAAGDVYQIFQMIEGNNTVDLAFGTSSAQAVTISFWVRSSVVGLYGFRLQNSNASRTYVATYTINSADTWEYKSVTVPGDTAGTWLTDTGIGIGINFDIGSGSNQNGTAGSWSSADVRRTSACVNWISTAGATFYLTGVQLEKGPTATSFDYRPYGLELSLCQRYFQYVSSISAAGSFSNLIFARNRSAANEYDVVYNFIVSMRASPTTTIESGARAHLPGVVILAVTITANAATTERIALRAVPASDQGTGAYQCWLDGDGTTAKRILFSAEL